MTEFKLIVIKRDGSITITGHAEEAEAGHAFDAAYTDPNTLFPALFKRAEGGEWVPYSYDQRYQSPEPGQWDKFQGQAVELAPIQRTTLDNLFG